MKLINLEQGSEQWLEFRRSRIGASDVAAILGICPYGGTAYKKWQEKCAGHKTETTRAMRYGTNEEETLRNMYCDQYQLIRPCVALSDERDYVMASFDGITADRRRCVEIKHCRKEYFEMIGDHVAPDHFFAQGQIQMYVNEKSEVCDLVARHNKQVVKMEIFPDKVKQKEMLTVIDNFYYNHMLSFQAPALTEGDYSEREDEAFSDLSERWLHAHEALRAATAKEKLTRAELIKACEQKCTLGKKVKVSFIFRKGAVDYAKIPELKKVDVEQYRKEGVYMCNIDPIKGK